MQKIVNFLVLWISFFIVACQSSQNIRATPTLNQEFVATNTVATRPLTPEEPEYTETPIPSANLGLKGQLWIRQNWSEDFFLVYNLTSGERKTVEVPPNCLGFIENSEYIFCWNTEEELFLFNPLSKEIVETPITKASWLNQSPDGKFLAYKEIKVDTEEFSVFSFDIETRISRELHQLDAPEGSRLEYGFPILSKDAKYLQYINSFMPKQNGTEIGLFNTETSKLEFIKARGIPLLWHMAWSPYENILIYGAIDGDEFADVAENATHLYMLNTATGNIELLDFDNGCCNYFPIFPNSQIWSPDGNRVAVSIWEELCIIELDLSGKNCFRDETAFAIRFPTWSPYSEHVMFDDGRNVSVFNIITEEFDIVLEDVWVYSLHWK